jgi:hypothetical protein
LQPTDPVAPDPTILISTASDHASTQVDPIGLAKSIDSIELIRKLGDITDLPISVEMAEEMSTTLKTVSKMAHELAKAVEEAQMTKKIVTLDKQLAELFNIASFVPNHTETNWATRTLPSRSSIKHSE